MGDPDGEGDVGLGATVEQDGSPRPATDIPEWLGTRYRVRRILGRGGMGAVYLAVDEALVCEVALKRIVAPGDALAKLRDEVRLAQKVTHANVCRTYDLEEIDGNWLVKMEYVAGETLAARLGRGPLPVDAVVDVATQICAGLAAAHRGGVVHRDLKPHNVMIESPGGRVVLMDFGIARAAALAGKTADNVSGTPEYMAPEQVRGREVDGRADLYALGCVLYEMLTGAKVFPRATPMAAALAHVNDPTPPLPASVPPRMARVVAALLEKDPARRPQSADAVATALAAPPRRRGRWIVGAAGVAAVAAVAAYALRPSHPWVAQIRELPSYDENSDAPTLSPDGKLIAYGSDRERHNSYRVYVAPLAGGPARAVSPPEMEAGFPRWTQDGAALLFASGVDVYRVAVAGGAPELVAHDARSAEDCAGRVLIQYTGSPQCPLCQRLALRERDGQERDLVRLAASQYIVPGAHCDRRGRRVVYAASDAPPQGITSRTDLWIVDVERGAPRRLTDDGAANVGSFAADGRSIVFSSMRSGQMHLWEMPLEGGRPRQLTFGEGWQAVPDVSADGRLVLFDVDITSSQLYAQPLAGGPRRKLTASMQQLMLPQPTPDGQAVLALIPSLRTRIVSVPAAGGDPIDLGEGETPALTPDGAEIVYSVLGTGRVVAMPRAGGAARAVGEAPGRIFDLSVGPDRTVHILLAREQSWEAWAVPLAGGEAARELPAPWNQLRAAPRGGWRALLEWRGLGPYRVRFLPPGAGLDAPGARELVATDWAQWTPDGRAWLYAAGDGRVHTYAVETGEDTALSADARGPGGALSPDGQTLYMMDLVSNVRRELITNFADRPR